MEVIMNSKSIKTGIIVAAFTGVIFAPTGQVLAADVTTPITVLNQNSEIELNQNVLIETVAKINNTEIGSSIKIESSEEIKLNEMLSGKTFAVVGEEGYLLVYSAADENSNWVGKVFEDSTIQLVEKTENWVEITSGNVKGFIKTEDVVFGKDAVAKAKELLAEKNPDVELTTLDQETIDSSFSVGETREEEEARLAAEEAKRIAEEQARIEAEKAAKRAQGQSVVDYAMQFIGNPYVWGGTSLTNGADCSGFVMSVYSHFGISMPRTSAAMRSAGTAVSYSEILPGDVICYNGHVGIYAGNGQIVNAIDDAHGIGMSSATYANIITIRRMF